MIDGWDVGVATMRKSELARFLVNPSYAFGDYGCPPRIPPRATSTLKYCEQCKHEGPLNEMFLILFICSRLVMFEIEMMGFVDYKAADEFSSLSKKEQREASLDQLIAVANAEREVIEQLYIVCVWRGGGGCVHTCICMRGVCVC